MKYKVWNIPTAGPIPEELTQAGYPPLLAAVLAVRGITGAGEAAAFLADGPFCPENPMDLPDMAAAVARLSRAREQRETVAVYGDYDVDGITAACLLTEFLDGIGLDTVTYIPDRLAEGYGLNNGAIDSLRDRGVTLIVTVDCGITAVEETAYAASLGIDMIITDHHECQAELPAAAAVVDPKRPGCAYPNRDLAGVGVAFKTACALSGDSAAMLARYADLVAVGTIADVMPLVGENRRLVKAGLEKLRADPRPGLAALMEAAGVTGERIGATAVGFTLAPRINAAGRLGRVGCAAELISERDPHRAAELAEALCGMNRSRQQLEAEIWEEAAAMLRDRTGDGPIVLAQESWHQGVIGIVASRLAEAYQVPTVMISLDGDKGKGSCRSCGGFNLFDALAACGDLLESFGGHALAAGLNISRENIGRFRRALTEYYADHPPRGEEGLALDLEIDSPELLKMECVESLEALEPWGNGNPRPSMCMTGAVLTSATPIGGGKHLRLRLEKFGVRYDCVWFSRQASELDVSAGDRVDAAFYPQVSEFRGRRSLQLVMLDLRPADKALAYRRVLEGRPPAADCHISRSELGRLWRALTARRPVPCPTDRLDWLCPDLRPEQIALGLRVLMEVELADVRFAGQDIDITLIARKGKADLDRSPAWIRQQG